LRYAWLGRKTDWPNIGQVFGVFGHVNLTASGDRVSDLFDSTVRLNNLYALEQWMAVLKPSPWRFSLSPTATPELTGYKARPLDGIWATAHYLHNGSVPNLYQLMLPPEERDKSLELANSTSSMSAS
jgi:hypothetical protein